MVDGAVPRNAIPLGYDAGMISQPAGMKTMLSSRHCTSVQMEP